MTNNNHRSSPRGVAVLLNVLILGVTALMATAILARGSFEGFLDSADGLSAYSTRAKVMGCLDEALFQLKRNNNYAPTSIFIGSATCTSVVTTPSSGVRKFAISLTEGAITRRISVTITLSTFTVTEILER